MSVLVGMAPSAWCILGSLWRIGMSGDCPFLSLGCLGWEGDPLGPPRCPNRTHCSQMCLKR